MKSPPLKIPYAFKGRKLVHISEVASGKNCGCALDPDGKFPVTAKKGEKNRHHFASSVAIDTDAAGETIYHALAKQVVAEKREFLTPHLNLEFMFQGYFLPLRKPRVLTDFEIKNESKIETSAYIADSILAVKNAAGKHHNLVVEWVVTHPCNAEKIRYLRGNKVPSIEVYLGQSMDSLTPEACRDWIIHSAPRRWIWHPAMSWEFLRKRDLKIIRHSTHSATRFYKTKNGVKAVKAQWVKHCPAVSKVVSTVKCRWCPYAYYVEYYQNGYVDCLAESSSAIKEAIRSLDPDLQNLKDAHLDGSDWYERATPNLGNGFRRGWDKPREDLEPEVRLEIQHGPYFSPPRFDPGREMETPTGPTNSNGDKLE